MTDEELRKLANELPWDRPDAARREAVRSQVLVAASEDDRGKRGARWSHIGAGFAAGIVAAAAVMALVWRSPAQPSGVGDDDGSGKGVAAVMAGAPRAAIEASAQANFEREVTASTSDGVAEVVHLHGGRLRLAVGALAASEHVRVQTHDAVVEAVEGAGDYEVAVAEDRLQTVTVHVGSARVTMDGRQAVFLASGQTWTAPAVTATIEAVAPSAAGSGSATTAGATEPATRVAVALAPSLSPSPSPSPSLSLSPSLSPSPSNQRVTVDTPMLEVPTRGSAGPASAPVSAPAPTSSAIPSAHGEVERHFQTGYALLRANHPDAAAAELAAAADANPDDPLASDARYLEAVALVQSHRPGEAEHALVAFLDRAPTSLRRGRAAVMLGRLIADRGDSRSARTWFESALHDVDPTVAAAARAGLDALDRAAGAGSSVR